MARAGAPMTCYLQERQLVLSLCLDKLQGSRMPSLHRSVLLANTMRHIQSEMIQEKDGPPANLCSTQVVTPHCSPDPQVQPLDCIPTLNDMDRGGVDLAYSKCAEEAEMEIDVSFFQSAFATSPSSATFTDAVFTDGGLLGLTSVIEAANTRGYLTDLSLDDIFEDIDTSMYDSSEASSILTCVFCSVSHLLGGDEESKVLTGCSSVNPLQCSHADLNDLDHIMEVIVGLV